MTERSVFSEQFPQANLLICLFPQKYLLISLVSHMEREVCVWRFYRNWFMQEMRTSTAPQRVVEYFDSNWHTIRHQWVDGLKNASCNFMNRTNNRVECINQKLKSVISRYSGMTLFFQDLMKCLHTLRVERDHRALDLTMKRRVTTYAPGTEFSQYMSLLTPYAFEYVKDQLERAK